ncbi:MAG: hypothetical protein ABJA11_03195 [Pseudolysinimonas sp.]
MRLRDAVVACAVALVAALSSCSSSPGPRTTPNAVERQAVAAASQYYPQSSDDIEWVQLWTITQAGPVIESCVELRSGGVVQADIKFSPGGEFGYIFTFDLVSTKSVDVQRYGSSMGATRVINDCIAQTPIDNRMFRLDASRVDELYSYYGIRLRRCLIAHGQRIAPAPSRTQFLRQRRAGTTWSPYDQVVVKTRADWYALSDSCPVLPPDLAAGL